MLHKWFKNATLPQLICDYSIGYPEGKNSKQGFEFLYSTSYTQDFA
jgi:hypothetical protein